MKRIILNEYISVLKKEKHPFLKYNEKQYEVYNHVTYRTFGPFLYKIKKTYIYSLNYLRVLDVPKYTHKNNKKSLIQKIKNFIMELI